MFLIQGARRRKVDFRLYLSVKPSHTRAARSAARVSQAFVNTKRSRNRSIKQSKAGDSLRQKCVSRDLGASG